VEVFWRKGRLCQKGGEYEIQINSCANNPRKTRNRQSYRKLHKSRPLARLCQLFRRAKYQVKTHKYQVKTQARSVTDVSVTVKEKGTKQICLTP